MRAAKRNTKLPAVKKLRQATAEKVSQVCSEENFVGDYCPMTLSELQDCQLAFMSSR